jgi:hypothetical protein
MMAFMAGSAAGAWLSPRVHPRFAAVLPLAALAGWGVFSWWLVSSATGIGMVGGTVTLAGIGAAVGGMFAAATQWLPSRQEHGIGRVYGADVLGGCLGSLAASLVLVPLAGMDVTALIVSGLAAASLVLAL